MEDTQIISLFFQRSDNAIAEVQSKYDRLAKSVARRILPDERDVEECISDAYMRLWDAIPPNKPQSLSAYLMRIVRNVSLDKYNYNTAEKRSTALTSAFEELEAFLPTPETSIAEKLKNQEFEEFINRFLRRQSKEARIFFVRRYWYGENIREISESCGVGEAKVKSSLFRTRNKLRLEMEKEGIYL